MIQFASTLSIQSTAKDTLARLRGTFSDRMQPGPGAPTWPHHLVPACRSVLWASIGRHHHIFPAAARQSAAVSRTLRPTACPEPLCLPQALASSFDSSADLQRRAADMKASYRPLSHSSPPTCIFALLRRLYRPAVRHSSTAPLTHPLEE